MKQFERKLPATIGGNSLTFRKRLERLERTMQEQQPVCLQYGWLRKLPRDYRGQRHIEITKRLIVREGFLEWVEAEEVPGLPSTIR
jgi:hypothetical protein